MTNSSEEDGGQHNDELTATERIARTTVAYPNHSRLAFDANGSLIDWQGIDSDTWANDTTPQQRVHVFAGGANRAIIAQALRSHNVTG